MAERDLIKKISALTKRVTALEQQLQMYAGRNLGAQPRGTKQYDNLPKRRYKVLSPVKISDEMHYPDEKVECPEDRALEEAGVLVRIK